MADGDLKLVSAAYTTDAFGVRRDTLTERTVFCQSGSVTRDEFFSAGRDGLTPQIMFTVFAGDYGGESLAEYGGEMYSIYRTYQPPGSDYIELYAERKGGTNGKTGTQNNG